MKAAVLIALVVITTCPCAAEPGDVQVKDSKEIKKQMEPVVDSVAWDKWNRRVLEEIWLRFNKSRAKEFPDTEPGPRTLKALISFAVTSDGQIVNAHVSSSSSNKRFDALALQSVKSLTGNSVFLAFPTGSECKIQERSIRLINATKWPFGWHTGR